MTAPYPKVSQAKWLTYVIVLDSDDVTEYWSDSQRRWIPNIQEASTWECVSDAESYRKRHLNSTETEVIFCELSTIKPHL